MSVLSWKYFNLIGLSNSSKLLLALFLKSSENAIKKNFAHHSTVLIKSLSKALILNIIIITEEQGKCRFIL